MATTNDLPPLSVISPGANKYRYKPQFGVILVCDGENEQIKLFEALNAIKNSKIKVVVT